MPNDSFKNEKKIQMNEQLNKFDFSRNFFYNLKK